jgi:hypothetical protein
MKFIFFFLPSSFSFQMVILQRTMFKKTANLFFIDKHKIYERAGILLFENASPRKRERGKKLSDAQFSFSHTHFFLDLDE